MATLPTPTLDLRAHPEDPIPHNLTFTRATTGYRRDPQGLLESMAAGELRHDYDPDTGEHLGWLLEGASTNICLQSEDLSTTWANTRSSDSSDATTAPDGATTADKLVEDATASNTHFISQTVTITANQTYTFSVFLKASERTEARVQFADGSTNGFYVDANLSAGTVGSVTVLGTGTATSAGIEAYPDSWYRVWATGKSAAASTSITPAIFLMSSGSTSYSGDGSSGAFAWGGQIELKAYPTSYISTTTTSATRNADALSISTSDFDFNATEGTIYASAVRQNPSVSGLENRTLWCLNDTTGNELHSIWVVNPNDAVAMYIVDGGALQANGGSVGTVSRGDPIRAAYAYKLNDLAISLNGETAVADTGATIPTVTQLEIGVWAASLYPMEGHIRQVTYYPYRISDANLKYMTEK